MKYKILLLIVSVTSLSYSQNIKRRGGLGVGLYNTISDSLYTALKLTSREGALVKFVVPQSTASTLKVQTNDLIVSCNDKVIRSTTELILMARFLSADDPIKLKVLRNNKSIELSGKVVGKPLEKNDVQDITYGEFKYENGYIRTIYKKAKNKKPLGTVYFIHGISCYSLDNMQANDITKKAFDAMIERGFAVYCVEKLGLGDSYNGTPCDQIGYDKELDVFRAAYKNLLKMKDVDTTQIFIFGHSLGGISAPIISEEFNPKGVVVYGTGLKPWSDYLLDAYLIQSRYYGIDLAELRDSVEFMKPAFYEYFYKGKSIDELSKNPDYLRALQMGLGYDPNTKMALAGRTPQFHRELNTHNLAKSWKNTKSFVLSIYGESDIAANNSIDHEMIVEYVNQNHPNKATYLMMPKTNHTFQEICTMEDYIKMQSNPMEYEKYASQHFNTKLFDEVCNWMKDKLDKKL